jgi:ankyrin repeat protein
MTDEFSRYCPQEGSNLLHVASGANLRTTVTALLQQDADIEQEDNWGNRSLHYYAIRRGHKELAEMLLSAGSLVSVRNNNEAPPFMLAAEFGTSRLFNRC